MDGDLHVAGPMPGKDWSSLEEILGYEGYFKAIWQPYYDTISLIPSETDWRPLRVIPQNLQWAWLEQDQLKLQFALPSGCYATGLLFELGNCQDTSTLEVVR
jgi:tRNA pseudouridine13 synthase